MHTSKQRSLKLFENGLPAKELANEFVPKAAARMQSESILAAAEAIMTTDCYPKVRSATLCNGARVEAIEKGTGMIEPCTNDERRSIRSKNHLWCHTL
jgi:N-acetylglutamate synthase/N-acetylornithine aminotransferase